MTNTTGRSEGTGGTPRTGSLPMQVSGIVAKEFERSIRSYTLLALSALFVFSAGGLAAIAWVPIMFRGSPVDTSTLALLNSMRQPTVVLVPAIGIALGYAAIVGEVERGSIKLVLGLPVRRGAVVLGALFGRTAVLGVAVLVGYGVVGAIALGFYATFDAAAFLGYSLLTVVYGMTYVAIATGFSAFARSRGGALFGAIALYALFMLFWDLLMIGLQYATVGATLPESGLPVWVQFVGLLNPANAFTVAARGLVPEYAAVTTLPESDAVVLQPTVAVGILLAWIVVPIALGYLRFRVADLQAAL